MQFRSSSIVHLASQTRTSDWQQGNGESWFARLSFVFFFLCCISFRTFSFIPLLTMSIRRCGRRGILTGGSFSINSSPSNKADNTPLSLSARKSESFSPEVRFQDYQPQKVSCSARHMDQMMPDLIPFDTATENIPSEEELNRIEDEKFDKLIGGTPSTFKKLSDVLEKFEIEFGKG